MGAQVPVHRFSGSAVLGFGFWFWFWFTGSPVHGFTGAPVLVQGFEAWVQRRFAFDAVLVENVAGIAYAQ
jgi:hypothetical protein